MYSESYYMSLLEKHAVAKEREIIIVNISDHTALVHLPACQSMRHVTHMPQDASRSDDDDAGAVQ